MALPRIVEQLLAIPKESGFPIKQGVSQLSIDFPANTSLWLYGVPEQNEYAKIVYTTIFDPQMVPEAFYIYMQYWGSRIYEGIPVPGFPLDSLTFITASNPAVTRAINVTSVTQFYRVTLGFLSIRNERDFIEARKIIESLQGETQPDKEGR